MILVLAFHSADAHQLHALLRFCSELGGCAKHKALLVADADTPYPTCAKAQSLAKQCFGEVRCVSNGKGVKGWPQGPNSLFWAAAQYIYAHWAEEPGWLLMETDAVPLKPGWLDAIEHEYRSQLHPFMGDVYHGLDSNTGLPVRALSGIAVYTSDTPLYLTNNDNTQAWDMENRAYLLEHGHATGLIKHLYGTKELPPTFVARKDNATPNAFTVDDIRKEAVVFHRNKDGTLLKLLRERLGFASKDGKFELAYICVSKGLHSDDLAKRFLDTYRRFPAGVDHVPTVIFNGLPVPDKLRALFTGFNQYQRSNLGHDIGGYIEYSKVTQADLLLCLGESVYFHRAGWFAQIADAWRQYGAGFYGVYSSNLVRQHCPTTAFAITPEYLKQYPQILTKGERYAFEHGVNAMWKRVQLGGGATRLVTWSGAYPPAQWRSVKNIFWTGNQSECLMWCNHTDRYLTGNAEVKKSLEDGANRNTPRAPGFMPIATRLPALR